MTDLQLFVGELTLLTKKYGYKIGGCGCCGSPWVYPVKTRVGHYQEVLDTDEDIELLEWTEGK